MENVAVPQKISIYQQRKGKQWMRSADEFIFYSYFHKNRLYPSTEKLYIRSEMHTILIGPIETVFC